MESKTAEAAKSDAAAKIADARQAIEHQILIHLAARQQPCNHCCDKSGNRMKEPVNVGWLYWHGRADLYAFIKKMQDRIDHSSCPFVVLVNLYNEVQRKQGINKKRQLASDDAESDNVHKRPTLQQNGPKLVSHQLRDLAKQDFGTQPKLSDYDIRTWSVSWDLARAIAASRIDARDQASIITFEDLQSKLKSHPNARRDPVFVSSNSLAFRQPYTDGDEAAIDAAELTLTASITLNQTSAGPLFKTTLLPIKPDRHCRAQRRWHWDRLLYVSLVVFPLPGFLSSGDKNFNECILDWLDHPHELLGRTWRAFHVEDYKKRQSRVKKETDEFHMKRVVFFATDGVGLRSVPFQDFVNWMVPLKHNGQQSVCKAAARFDLPLSRTRSTIVFKLGEIEIIDDVLPSTTKNQMPYQDPNVKHNAPLRAYDGTEAMTDGCGIISVGAALQVCEALRINSLPSAFQARIFGAKGLWIVSNSYDTQNEHHLSVWIQIRKSQLKVNYGHGTNIDAKYKDDATLRSFDVNRFSTLAKTSDLHRDFLTILIDRGVKPKEILKMVANSLANDSSTMLRACTDAEELAVFVSKGDQTSTGLDERSGLPLCRHERIMFLLTKGGFSPAHCDFMAKEFQALCCRRMLDDLEKMRIRCEESTVLLGVPDPTGILLPGQIFVSFSSALKHAGRRTSIKDLAGKQVIVARDPTLRPSDMQKYDCIYIQELAHLQDVVVFSIRGNMPAACRHQGGDYDGDVFTVLWSKSLVENFQNVPVYQPKSYHELEVTKDRQQLGELAPRPAWGGEKHCKAFLRKGFSFRMRDNLLGKVTNLFYAITYKDISIWSEEAFELADLHDLLVDNLKQGYSFTYDDFVKFTKARGLYNKEKDSEPEYKASISEVTDSVERSTNLARTLQEKCVHGMKKLIVDTAPILDQIYFNVKLPHIAQAITGLGEALQYALVKDQDLLRPLEYFRKTQPKGSERLELIQQYVAEALVQVDQDWTTGHLQKRDQPIQAAFDGYRAIAAPGPLRWMEYARADNKISNWDELCASIFYEWTYRTTYAPGKSTRLFHLAGKALCEIKRTSISGEQTVKLVAGLQRVRRRDKSGMVRSHDTLTSTASQDDADLEFEISDQLLSGMNEMTM